VSAQHTPGPWEFAEWNAGINGRPGYGLIAEHGSLNVTVHTRKPKGDGWSDVDCTEQAQADARLIAAAPDLLEALQFALHANYSNFMDMKFKAAAAIAKAKGERP
jgi:hypothetical protein